MTKRRLRIIEFLIIGIGLGVFEDLLAIVLATDATINFQILLGVVAVAVPFAFISEVIVDHPKFWEKIIPGLARRNEDAVSKKRLRILEFLVVGIGMGITEDLLAVHLATGTSLSADVLIIVVAVAIPFAFISEMVVDHPRFWQNIFPKLKKIE